MSKEIQQVPSLFSGIMDTDTDISAIKDNKHRYSLNFESISHDDNEFVFQTMDGMTLRTGVRTGFKIIGWAAYENSIYVISTAYHPQLNWSPAEDVDGKVALNYDSDHEYVAGEWIYIKKTNSNIYDRYQFEGAFEILDVPTSTQIIINLDSSTIGTENLVTNITGTSVKQSWGEVGKLVINSTANTGVTRYVPIYSHQNLRVYLQAYISREGFVIVKENGQTLRLYWTDYAQSPKTLNANSSILSHRILNNELEDGKTYMVLESSAVYDGVSYSVQGVAGNIFTATTAQGLTYTNNATVIEYFPIELLDWSPDFQQGDIQYTRTLSGNVSVGVYSAVYRLTDQQGAVTPWSLPTNPIYLGKKSFITTIEEYWENEGALATINSGYSLLFNISDIDTNWTNIQCAIIKHIGKDTFEIPYIFENTPITGSEMDIEFTGTGVAEQITIAEINILYRWFKRLLTIENMQSELTGGNFESSSLLSNFIPNLPEIGYVVKECVTDHIMSIENETVSTHNAEAIQEIDAPYGIINPHPYPLKAHIASIFAVDQFLEPKTYYEITTGNIEIGESGDLRTYYKGTIFTRVVKSNIVAITGIIKPVIIVRKHQNADTTLYDASTMITGKIYELVTPTTNYLAGDLIRYDGSIDFGTGYIRPLNVTVNESNMLDGNSPLVQNRLMSFPRREKIRIGILPVDKKGSKLPVRWLGDYDTPSIATTDLIEAEMSVVNEKNTAWLNHLGLVIGTEETPLDISSIMNDISGFHIVVSPIQRQIKVQGLLSKTVVHGENRIGPSVFECLANDYHQYTYQVDYPLGYDRGAILFSPDVLFLNEEEIGVQIDDEIYIEKYYESNEWTESPSGDYVGYNYDTPYDPDFFAGGAGSDPLSSIKKFAKYNNEAADQTTDKDAIGSTIKLTGSKKIGVQASALWPDQSNVVYETDAYTSPTGEPLPDYPSKALRSRVYNHLLMSYAAIPSRGTFGVQNVSTKTPALASVQSPSVANYGSIETSQYVTTGHFQKVDSELIELTNGLLWDIEVFGGQTFLSLFGQVRNVRTDTELEPFSSESFGKGRFDYIIGYPVQSIVNPYRRVAAHAFKSREELSPINIEVSVVADDSKYTGALIKYASLANIEYENTFFERHIAWSKTKINGERIDSFRQFPFFQIKECENDLERIVAIKKMERHLLIWHEKGVSYFPVREKATLQGEGTDAIILGYSGIYESNFAIDNATGLQHRSALVETPDTFYWISARAKSIVMLNKKSKPQYFSDENFIGAIPKALLSNNDILKIDNPFYNQGIIGAYDALKKRVLFTFLVSSFNSRTTDLVRPTEHLTLMISNTYKQPLGYCNFHVDQYIWLDTFLYSTLRTPKEVQDFTTYDPFSIVVQNNTYYVAISENTTGEGTNLATNVRWVAAGAVNSLYQHNLGSKLKFHGLTWDAILTPASSDPRGMLKVYDAVKVMVNREPGSIRWTTDYNASAEELNTIEGWDVRENTYSKSFPFATDGERPRGLGIEVSLTFFGRNTSNITSAVSNMDIFVRQMNIFKRILNIK